jgi:hypothetical protein
MYETIFLTRTTLVLNPRSADVIYFCNIHMKHLQHTSETSEILETYAGNISGVTL